MNQISLIARAGSFLLIPFLSVGIMQCSAFSYSNIRLSDPEKPYNGSASFSVPENRRKDKTLFILALSGGGSRAAYLSTSVMAKLSKMELLDKVDVISSVSGGSIAGAYYCVTGDKSGEATSWRVWDEKSAKEAMKKNFIGRFVANLFWPDNFFLYWFTSLTRTEIMAQTLADNLFDTSFFGFDLKMKDLNRNRPKLLMNATTSTFGKFGFPFVFNHEDFQKLGSDIEDFPVSRAVMGSAGFPGAFQYSVLRDFTKEERRFLHIYDGGVYDNLGLYSAREVIEKNKDLYQNFVVISVDAFNGSLVGNSPTEYNTKGYLMDSTIMDSFDFLLRENRDYVLSDFGKYEKYFRKNNPGKEFVFLHLGFENLIQIAEGQGPLRENTLNIFKQSNEIPTNLSISDEHSVIIDQAVDILLADTAGNAMTSGKFKKIQSLFEKKESIKLIEKN